MTAIGVGQFKNVDRIVYVGGSESRFHNFDSLAELKAFVGSSGIYDLMVPNAYPIVEPLSPHDKAYILRK